MAPFVVFRESSSQDKELAAQNLGLKAASLLTLDVAAEAVPFQDRTSHFQSGQ
jgi:hypothetical protein